MYVWVVMTERNGYKNILDVYDNPKSAQYRAAEWNFHYGDMSGETKDYAYAYVLEMYVKG